MTSLALRSYLEQRAGWPSRGRHILAQYDEESVVVYQAYRPAIGRFAAEHGTFGGEFSYSRMSWIKPNFLWMVAEQRQHLGQLAALRTPEERVYPAPSDEVAARLGLDRQ